MNKHEFDKPIVELEISANKKLFAECTIWQKIAKAELIKQQQVPPFLRKLRW